jgi:cell pole-organizing protein PopZ
MTMGAKSLEDGFKELLRPMILQWLDENMPRLLDDAVQQEVRRRLGKG